MNPESETIEALKRAGARAAYHLLKAGVETLKAMEAVIDELGRARQDTGESADPSSTRQHIDVE